jgi:transposase
MHISQEGDPLMVQGAHYILGPFGEDSDLRRWGQKLAERGRKNAKKRAVVAVARKLAVLLQRLWVSGEVYEPLRNNQKTLKREHPTGTERKSLNYECGWKGGQKNS